MLATEVQTTSALRRAGFRLMNLSIFLISGFQKCPDQRQQTFIRYHLPENLHKYMVVWNIVEAALDVAFNHPVVVMYSTEVLHALNSVHG